MSIAMDTILDREARPEAPLQIPPTTIWRRVLRSGRIMIAGGVVLAIVLATVCTLPLTMSSRSGWGYDNQYVLAPRDRPHVTPTAAWWGTDTLGRSLIGRCLFGGAASLAIGVAAATLSVFLGVSVGLVAGYRGGWI